LVGCLSAKFSYVARARLIPLCVSTGKSTSNCWDVEKLA
jgi:hypothetical protein